MESKDTIEFICLGSGSTGNAYVFKKHDHYVLVECGFEYNKLAKKILNANLLLCNCDAVVVTHKHSDHAKALKEFIEKGVNCYAPETCFADEYKSYPNVHIVNDGDKFTLNNWLKILCFPVCHDVEAYGYAFLDTENKDSILFINDTKLFDFKYNNVGFNYIFIECNHIRKQLEAIMQKSLDDGKEHEVFKFKRQASYHLGLYSCKKLLNKMNLSQTRAIFLMHLSRECCNDTIVKAEINEVYKKPTFVCYENGRIN